MSTVIESNEPAVSPEQKFFVEAAKRKKDDGLGQFESLHFTHNKKLHNLVEDIAADHDALDKLPIPTCSGDHVKFLVMGAGIGGILVAVNLVKRGFTPDQILLVDTAGGVGGTWYWNRYPGLHSDTEAYAYMPLLEDTGYMPKQKYASHVEIRTYLENLVKQFGLDSRVLLRSQVTGLEWDEKLKSWKTDVTMHRGPGGKEEEKISLEADFATIAGGVFPYPQVPRVPGLADFEGPMFHTARWDYNITGGTADTTFPELSELKGKRVGYIGTGATAIQAVPQLAKYAKDLHIFQRTPAQVMARNQRDTDPTEWREKIAAKPGWYKERKENLAMHFEGILGPDDLNLVDDEWVNARGWMALTGSNRWGLITPDKAQEHIGNLLAYDSEQTAKVRARVGEIVHDKETAKKLTPWYPTWCKRPGFSDTYLQTFNQENVHLIDTDGRGIDSVTSKSIVANGQDYPIDILILGTGFRSPAVAGDPGSVMGVKIIGRDGQLMADKWSEEGGSTLHGVFTNGFPNLFFHGARQSSASSNYQHFLEVVSEHITSIIAIAHKRASDKQAKVVLEPSVAASDAWCMQIAQGSAYFSGLAICTPNYMNLYGDAFKMPPADDYVALLKKAKSALWYKGLLDYSHVVEEWRSDEKLEGVDIEISA